MDAWRMSFASMCSRRSRARPGGPVHEESMTRGRLAATTGFGVAAFACATAAVTAEKAPEPAAYRWDLPKGFPRPRVPAANPMSGVKVELARYLFYDKRMSGNRTQASAPCPGQELAFTDGKPLAEGATGQIHTRSAMSLVNVAYSTALTWSNPGLHALEEQALTPMFGRHPVELGLSGRTDDFLERLRSDAVSGRCCQPHFPASGTPSRFQT